MKKEQNSFFLGKLGDDIIESRQVYQRLVRLLPVRYEEIVQALKKELPAGKARRRAYTDEKYLAYIREINEWSGRLHELRVKWDIHRMEYKNLHERR